MLLSLFFWTQFQICTFLQCFTYSLKNLFPLFLYSYFWDLPTFSHRGCSLFNFIVSLFLCTPQWNMRDTGGRKSPGSSNPGFFQCCGTLGEKVGFETKQPPHTKSSVFLKKLFLYMYFAVLSLSCSKQDLVSWPGIEPQPLALGAWHHSHWTTREVPQTTRSSGRTFHL